MAAASSDLVRRCVIVRTLCGGYGLFEGADGRRTVRGCDYSHGCSFVRNSAWFGPRWDRNNFGIMVNRKLLVPFREEYLTPDIFRRHIIESDTCAVCAHARGYLVT